MGIIPFIKSKKRKIFVLLIDALTFAAINLLYYFNMSMDAVGESFNRIFFIKSLLLFLLMFTFRLILKIYRSVWRYPNTNSYLTLILADGISCITTLFLIVVGRRIANVEISFRASFWHIATVAVFTAMATLVSRFFYRYLYSKKNNTSDAASKIPVAIVGAGQIGALLAEDLLLNERAHYRPLFFIDNDRAKTGNRISGLNIYPQDDKILDFIRLHEIKEIFIAIPSLDGDTALALYNFYKKSGCKVKLYDSSSNGYSADDGSGKKVIREFRIEDLLFRQPMNDSDPSVENFYKDKVVLVTGGGGSIGSELCRQIAKCSPKKLIVLDIYENNAYDIQQELVRNYGRSLDLSIEIASVRDRERLDTIFAAYRPNVVFHAAAHKHVPLMEHSSCEAIKNNVFGTRNTADMAEKYGVDKFILISTDKAVNPTNVMGASKRMCEMIVRCRNDSKTSFSAVRFGNVLGSNGSVIPLFKRQIAEGGPLTITDKRIIRYFMTIAEASRLVMRAGAMADRGELFVLDMGKPVRIYDLAVNMIRLSGLEPDKDIQIKEIGLRPGEKLYEELLIKTDTLTQTKDNMIFVEQEKAYTREEVNKKLTLLADVLERSKYELASEEIKEVLKQVVPTFCDPESINSAAESAEEMKSTGVV